jgi:hypothetical protein
LGAAGAFVFFSHAEPLTGTELWAVPVAASVYARHEVFLPIMRDNRPTPTFEPYPFPNEPFPEQPPATAYVPVRP